MFQIFAFVAVVVFEALMWLPPPPPPPPLSWGGLQRFHNSSPDVPQTFLIGSDGLRRLFSWRTVLPSLMLFRLPNTLRFAVAKTRIRVWISTGVVLMVPFNPLLCVVSPQLPASFPK